MVQIIYQCENGSAYGNSRCTLVARLFPGFFIQPDLLSLLYMERFAAFIEFQGGTLKVHALFGGPNRRSIRSSAPPNSLPQSFGMGFQSQQTRWIRKHRVWTRLGKPDPF